MELINVSQALNAEDSLGEHFCLGSMGSRLPECTTPQQGHEMRRRPSVKKLNQPEDYTPWWGHGTLIL